MTRLGLSGLAMLVTLTGFSAVGCCEKEKNDLMALQTQHDALQKRYAAVDGARQVSDQNLATMTAEVDKLRAENTDLRSQLAAGGQKKGPDDGTNKGPWKDFVDGAQLNLEADVLFDAGQATIKAAGKTALDKAAGDLKGTYSGLPVLVYGYTDNDPIRKSKKLWQDNLDLSANRAMAVTRYLISQGIPASQIQTIAMGDSKATGSSKSDKAKDRRVEIVVIKKSN